MNITTLFSSVTAQRTVIGAAGLMPGLLLVMGIAALASWAAQWPAVQSYGLSPLTLAILMGVVIGNSIYPGIASQCASGIAFSKARLLRAGIVLYGLRLTFQEIGQVGIAAVVIDMLILFSTFLLAQWVGQKWLGMDKRTTVLVGAGASICGAAAVLATQPVVKGRTEDVAVAIATVVVFGSISTFLYPALFFWNAEYGWIDISLQQYGIFVGSSVHEVAQVVAAGEAVGIQAADTAVIAKMVRVMMLAPFLLLLSIWLARQEHGACTSNAQLRTKITVPWFAVGFVLMAGIHSLGILPSIVISAGIHLDNVLLTIAMAALGLTTHIRAVRAAGVRPLLLALVLFFWLLIAGLVFNLLLPRIFNLN